MKIKLLLLIIVLTLTSPLVNAAIVDIGVETDKPTYLLEEPVTVFVTAYNPNPEAVTLGFGSTLQATYLMNDVFDWSEGKGFADVVTSVTIEPDDSYVWDLTHGLDEMMLYPLDVGIHTVVGEVVGYGQSATIEFEVVPEPATVLLLGFGGLILRS